MKKKSRFLVHIALIALSLCIMVYGVYAAKQAQLRVTGTIGFTAHNGAVDVQLTGISGAYDIYHNKVVIPASGTSVGTGQVALAATSTTTVTAGSTTNNLTIKTTTTKQTGDENTYADGVLTALYFDDVENSTATQDVITNIVFTFTATNKALFAMKLNESKLTGNALTGGRVTYTIAANATNSMAAGTKGSDNNVTDGGTLTFTITLTLASTTPDATTMENLTAAAFSVPVEFIKA